jgi:F-type H+-transporting ATPase subunit epsilon
MPARYELVVLAPDRKVYEGRVEGLVAPGSLGYFGVLARHAPMVAELTAGELSLVEGQVTNQTGSGQRVRKSLAVSGGYLEVGWSRVTVLVEAAESAEEIDIMRARAAQERAQERLHACAPDVDVPRAEAALRRALNRLRVAQKSQRQT